MIIPIIVLGVIFLLIAIRQVGNIKLQIWQIMLGGAIIVLATGQISPGEALHSINLDVMLFLFGMFVVGQALEESGYLSYISYKFFKHAKSMDMLMILILFSSAMASALLMNDTLAIIGTPVMLLLAKKHKMHPQVLLLALAFGITIGSVMSPIGNPQNLLIALNGNLQNPFVTFLKFLFVPTVINLVLCFFLLKWFYKEKFHKSMLNHLEESIKGKKLAFAAKVSCSLILVLIAIKIGLILFKVPFDLRLTYIALIAAMPILFNDQRVKIVKQIDWHTLIFFAAMFIVMESVWLTGFFQSLIAKVGVDITSTGMIFGVSILLSQLISNVPLVALYLPLLMHAGAGTKALMALAAGSTIAGNLLILGAASNVIIIQNAEKRSKESLSFLEFAKIGIPLTLLNVLVYWLFLSF